MKVILQKKLKFYNSISILAISGCALFGLQACGDDGASAEKESDFVSKLDEDPFSSATDEEVKSSDSQSQTSSSNSNKSNNPSVASSASKTATESSEEILNDEAGVVKGSCTPNPSIINKGELATWTFLREEGDVFDAIMAPFVWNFPELNKTIQGNGYNTVNIEYPESGVYTATLKVDGNEITCSPLHVQGVPITVKSCKATKNSVTAGETISWSVEAESESEITGYSWKSDDGTVTENGKSATMQATADMHKKTVKATVSISNADKTVQDYFCEAVSVVDPNQVDVVIPLTTADSSKVFNAGETIVAQYPPNAVNCQMVCGASGNGVILEIDGTEYIIDYSLNITPESCTDGSAAGTKISVKASMQVLCYVTY